MRTIHLLTMGLVVLSRGAFQRWGVMMSLRVMDSTPCGQTDTSENDTLSQTSFAGGKNSLQVICLLFGQESEQSEVRNDQCGSEIKQWHMRIDHSELEFD